MAVADDELKKTLGENDSDQSLSHRWKQFLVCYVTIFIALFESEASKAAV